MTNRKNVKHGAGSTLTVSLAFSIAAFLICLVLTGCGSAWTSIPSIANNATLTASLTTTDSTPSLGTQSTINWQTAGANVIQVQGDDLASTDPDGTQTEASDQNSTYFLAAVDQSGSVITQSVTIQVTLTIAQQQATHAQWLAGVQNVAASLGCASPIAVQQVGQQLQDTLAQAILSNSSCIVLLPTSTSEMPNYNMGLASSTAGGDIIYISDASSTPVFNPVLTY